MQYSGNIRTMPCNALAILSQHNQNKKIEIDNKNLELREKLDHIINQIKELNGDIAQFSNAVDEKIIATIHIE